MNCTNAAPPSDAARLLQTAVALHQKGQLDEARQIYENVLAREPQHPDALRLLAIAWREKGDFSASRRLFERALASQPNCPQLHHDFALLCCEMGETQCGIEWFRRSIELAPAVAESHYNLGNAYLKLGQRAEAEACYLKAIEHEPDLLHAHYNLGLTAVESGRFAESVRRFFRAWQLSGGGDAQVRRSLESARSAFLDGLARKWGPPSEAHAPEIASGTPEDQQADVWAQLALESERGGSRDESIRCLIRACSLAPSVGYYDYLLGSMLHQSEAYEEAAAAFCLGIVANASPADSFHNYACSLMELKRYAEAAECYQVALSFNPNYHEARHGLGAMQLLLGDWPAGWLNYESRPKPATHRQIEQSSGRLTWRGERFDNGTLFVLTEQGFGDAIQFVRFAAQARARGGRLILGCDPSLKPLLQTAPGVDQVICPGEKLPPFDYQVSLLSLPAVLQTTLKTLPAQAPYLDAPPGVAVELPAPRTAGRKVGVVWAGDPSGDFRRSIPLGELATLFSVAGCAFYSLQVGPRHEELKGLRDPRLIDLNEQLSTWAHTAAVLKQLDLVISIDTAVAHLAGAMGRPVWTLLKFNADWRWLVDREDTPWYPTMRLFRQGRRGDWKEVVERVRLELIRFAS